MPIEKIQHTAVSRDTVPFTLSNGGAYSVSVSGLVAGGDTIELQMFNNKGQPVGLPDGIRFNSLENGSVKQFQAPAGTTLRWRVSPQGNGVPSHSMTSSITSAA
jgi:hypothetical protein